VRGIIPCQILRGSGAEPSFERFQFVNGAGPIGPMLSRGVRPIHSSGA
jgi:hypothetical protein